MRQRGTHHSSLFVYRTVDVFLSDTLVRIERFKMKCGVIGPVNSCDDKTVRSYMERVSGADRDLLWSLIRIASESDGKLRSDNGVTDSSSPESAIV
jgi:hypothetical protein